jgi:hypothetical protein
MKKESYSKELQNIEDALQAYYDKHNGDVLIHVSVCAFDSESNVIDDYLWMIGSKEMLLTSHECMLNEINDLVD